jgi:hypothetical protein
VYKKGQLLHDNKKKVGRKTISIISYLKLLIPAYPIWYKVIYNNWSTFFEPYCVLYPVLWHAFQEVDIYCLYMIYPDMQVKMLIFGQKSSTLCLHNLFCCMYDNLWADSTDIKPSGHTNLYLP